MKSRVLCSTKRMSLIGFLFISVFSINFILSAMSSSSGSSSSYNSKEDLDPALDISEKWWTKLLWFNKSGHQSREI